MEPLITVPGESWKVKGTMRKLDIKMPVPGVLATWEAEAGGSCELRNSR